MKLEIVEKNAEPLLHRKNIICVIKDTESTPKRTDVMRELSAKLGADQSKLFVRTITQHFGSNEFLVKANLYDTEDLAKKLEPKYIQERHKKTQEALNAPKEEPKKEEAAPETKEETPAEKPAEEKKE